MATTYLSFRVGHEWYALPIDQIIEVLHMTALTELPGTAPDVLGLLTLRQMLLPVVDLRQRFGVKQADLRLDTPIVALRHAGHLVGLVIDDIDTVEQDVEPIDYDAEESPYVTGAIKVKDRLLMLLDIGRIIKDTRIREIMEQAEKDAVETPVVESA